MDKKEKKKKKQTKNPHRKQQKNPNKQTNKYTTICCLQETYFRFKDIHGLKVKGYSMQMIIKRARIALLR